MAGSRGGGAVEALMLEASQAHVVADDVQHPHHLAEDQHPAMPSNTSASSAAALRQKGFACRAAGQEPHTQKQPGVRHVLAQ